MRPFRPASRSLADPKYAALLAEESTVETHDESDTSDDQSPAPADD